MKPFECAEQLAALDGQYPKVERIQAVIRHGQYVDRVAVARQWLSEGIPFAFQERPAIYEALRTWLSDRLSVVAKEISVTGSARLGVSLAPRKIGMPFTSRSDLDLFVVSDTLFEALRSDFLCWAGDFHDGEATPSNMEQLVYVETGVVGTAPTRDQQQIAGVDLVRVTNVAGTAVASLDAVDDLRRKLHDRA